MILRSLTVAWVALAPSLALACPVCGVGSEESQAAYIGSTVFMSLLPLLLIGAGVWWFGKRIKAQDAEVTRVRQMESRTRLPG